MIGLPSQPYLCAYCKKSVNYAVPLKRCPNCGVKLLGLIIKEPYSLD